jgi:dihydrofolate reductase
MIEIVLVTAVAENGVIGRGNAMPWRLRSDLRHFRALTWGKPVIMGRRTWASLDKPLPGRTNIVLSRDRSFTAPGVVIAPNFETALETARGDALRRGADMIAVIGGAELYAQSMPHADRICVTMVHARPQGDAVFPPIDPDAWREVERTEHNPGPGDDVAFAFVGYQRIATKHATAAANDRRTRKPRRERAL